MQQDIINKFKLIFKNFSNLEKDKEVNVWEVGTDFILNIKRFNYLIKEIFEHASIKDASNVEYITITSELDGKNEKGNERFKICVEVKLFHWNDEKIFYFTPVSRKPIFKKINKSEKSKLLARSTHRQMLETWGSMGYVSPQYKFELGFPLDVINIDSKTKENEEILNEIYEVSSKNWNYPSLKSNSIRDIIFTLIFTAYFLPNNIVNYDLLEECIGNNEVSFRDGSERDIEKMEEKFQAPTSSIKKQNWNKKMTPEIMKIIEKMLELVYKKATIGWVVEKVSSEYENLRYYSSTQNRTGQSTYRILMSNSIKRLNKEGVLEQHDIVDGVKSIKLVEAAHILDFRYCESDAERYDPENGLFIDPSLHKWFDKDLITFDTDGNMYISKKYLIEIKAILKKLDTYKIRETILTEKTIEYIKRRNRQHGINLNDFEKI